MTEPRKGDRSRTKNRVVRVSDEVWDAAKSRAEANGETVSDVIRRALVDYAQLPNDTAGVLGRADRAGIDAPPPGGSHEPQRATRGQ